MDPGLPLLDGIKVLFIARREELGDLCDDWEETESDPVFVRDIERARAKLIEDSFDCIVCGEYVEEDECSELISTLRNTSENISIIMLKQEDGQNSANDAINKGFDDYIVRDKFLTSKLFRKRIENTVKSRKAGESAQRILERVQDAFFAVDNELNFTYVNEIMRKEIWGKDEEIVGKNLWEAFPEAEGTVFQRKYEKALETQEPEYFESYFPPHQNWYQVKAFPSESGLSVYFSIINERKQWERQLQERLEQQEITTNLLRMVLEEDDTVELQQAAAKQVATCLGTDYAKIVKKDGEEMVLAAAYGIDASQIGRTLLDSRENFQSVKSFESRNPVVVEDFHESEYERSELLQFLNARSGISVVIGEINDPWGVMAVHDRKSRTYSQHEINFIQGVANIIGAALGKQEMNNRIGQYKNAFDALSDGIFVLDNKDRYLVANKAFQKISGYSDEELRGKSLDAVGTQKNMEGRGLITVINGRNGEKIQINSKYETLELPDGSHGKLGIVKNWEVG